MIVSLRFFLRGEAAVTQAISSKLDYNNYCYFYLLTLRYVVTLLLYFTKLGGLLPIVD